MPCIPFKFEGGVAIGCFRGKYKKEQQMENLVHDMMSRKRILEENGFNVSESQVIEYEGKPLYGFSVKYPEQGDKVVELYDLFSALNFTNTYTTEHGWFIGCGTTLESVDEALNTEIEVQHNE